MGPQTYVYIYLYIYIYITHSLRERERDKETERDRERQRETIDCGLAHNSLYGIYIILTERERESLALNCYT